VLRGDLDSIAFDCQELNRNSRMGDNRKTFACFRRGGKKLPWFSLAPGTLPSRSPVPLALFGIGVVKFDPPSEFSRNFLVHTRDHNPEAVKKLLGPDVQSQVLNLDIRHEWSVWGDDEWLCPRITAQTGVLTPEEYAGFLQRAAALADVFFQAAAGQIDLTPG